MRSCVCDDGMMDEIFIHVGNMTQTDITEVYNRATSWSAVVDTSTPPAITLSTPVILILAP